MLHLAACVAQLLKLPRLCLRIHRDSKQSPAASLRLTEISDENFWLTRGRASFNELIFARRSSHNARCSESISRCKVDHH
jgi:hypothetical protein